MNLDAIPLFSMLRSRMGYLTQRQELIAQNVANANTPGYAPKDLKPFTIKANSSAGAGMAPVALTPGHIAPVMANEGTWKAVSAPDSETTLNGNQVVLEDQMLKMSEARMNYDAAIGFYQKSLGLLRMAARAPGR